MIKNTFANKSGNPESLKASKKKKRKKKKIIAVGKLFN